MTGLVPALDPGTAGVLWVETASLCVSGLWSIRRSRLVAHPKACHASFESLPSFARPTTHVSSVFVLGV